MADETSPDGKKITRDASGRILAGSGALNPGGRPKSGGPFTRRFRHILEQPATPDLCEAAADVLGLTDPGEITALIEKFPTFGDLLAHCTARRALHGQVDFMREIGDRVDPKPRRIEVSGPGGGPVRGAIAGSQSEGEREEAADYFESLEEPNTE